FYVVGSPGSGSQHSVPTKFRRLRRACDRLQNLHQDVRLARIPDQFEVFGTVSVRNNKGLKGVALENQEFDLPLNHTVRNGVLNALAAELASVDARDLHAWRQARLVSRHARNDVPGCAIFTKCKAKGTPGRCHDL